MDLTNNEIENINERHTKLRQEHEKLKGEVETQNKYNADNQVTILRRQKNILLYEKNQIIKQIKSIQSNIKLIVWIFTFV